MKNTSETTKDQASELRELFNEVQADNELSSPEKHMQPADHEESNQTTNHYHSRIIDNEKIDILNLPPRKEYHSTLKKRTHIKWRKPFLRLFIMIILVLGLLSGIYYMWVDGIFELPAGLLG